jgi:glycerophosphoryl diester phosphodiesterase
VSEYNKKNNKSLVFGFIYRKNITKRFDYSKKGNSLNIYWKEATKEVCSKAHKNGMAVLVWFDMDEEENEKIFKRIIENGVDIICCNEPLLAKKYIKYYNYRKKK